MFQGDKPDLLIYHGYEGGTVCADGCACRWILRQKWPDVPTHVGIYGQAHPDVTGMRVLVADFSYPEDELRAMAEMAREVIVLDHHESSRLTMAKLLDEGVIRGVHDLTRSGAALTWEYVWGNRHHPRLISHVQDRDLWKFEVDFTREVSAVLGTLGEDMDAWTELGKKLEIGGHEEIHKQGALMLRRMRLDIENTIRGGTRMMIIGGVSVPVCNAPPWLASEIGHELAQLSPTGWAATYWDLQDGRKFSLRARGPEANVHKIAEEYGGGGHPAAAGFTVPLAWEGDVDDSEDPLHTIELRPGERIRLET